MPLSFRDERGGLKSKHKSMSRSLKKGPFVNEKLAKKVAAARATSSRKPIKTWARDSVITPDMVGMTLVVHNGNDFLNVLIDENMIGHKLGEFSPTRKFVKHGGKMQKEQEKAAAASAAPAPAPAAAKK